MKNASRKANLKAVGTAMEQVTVILEPLTPDERHRVIEAVKIVLDMKPPVVYRNVVRLPYNPNAVRKAGK